MTPQFSMTAIYLITPEIYKLHFLLSQATNSKITLFRGLDMNDRQLIPEAIKLLQQQGLIMLYNRGDGNVWVPVRKEINRARRILATPNACDDPAMSEAKTLGK